MSNKKLEIICIYRSKEGREVEFSFLKDGSDTMDYEDFNLPNFVSILGGFSLTVDGYHTIYRGLNFYNALKPISFLLESLFWLEGLSSNLLDTDEDFPSSVVLNTMIEEKLVLNDLGENQLTLSFIASSKEQEDSRGFYYFNKIPINRQVWKEEVTLALEEYFHIAEQVLSKNPRGQNSSVLLEYIRLWKKMMN